MRKPVLADGTPWPVASVDAIKAILATRKGQTPSMTIYIPYDGIGPVLVGSNRSEDFPQPSGYDAVELIGTPQETKEGHAEDGIVAALEMAWTHRYSAIFFNRSYTTITQGLVQSLRRSDVVGVAREGFNSPYLHHPYESLSEGQTLKDRQKQLPSHPSIKPLDGRLPSEWKREFGQ